MECGRITTEVIVNLEIGLVLKCFEIYFGSELDFKFRKEGSNI